MKLNKIVGSALLFIAIVLATSCGNIEELQIGNVKNIQLKGLNNNIVTLEMKVPIENPNPYRIKIKGSDLKISVKNVEVGKVTQMEKLVIPGKSSKDYDIRIKVEITNLLGGLAAAYKMASEGNPDVQLSGKIKVQSFIYCKTIQVDEFKLTR